MILLQLVSIILASIMILLLIVEKAKRRYFEVQDALKLVREKNRKLQRDVEDIFGIYEGVRNVTSILNIEEILESMSNMLYKFFDFSRAWLYFFNEEDGKFFINLSYDFSLKVVSRDKVELVNEEIKKLIIQKRAKISPLESEITNFEDEDDIPNIFMIVPLIVEKNVIGVIKMEREGEPFLPFSPDDLHKLSILCAQTSMILRRGRLYAEVERLAIIDGLTGLYVHRYFQEKLVAEMKRANAYNGTFALLMADIDYFKRYNDDYGHLVGDELLRRVSRILKDGVLETDIVARYGGEEFAVILLNRSEEEAKAIAEDLRKRVESLKIEIKGGKTGVTISMGLAVLLREDKTKDKILERADSALYQAKAGGRNQVVVYGK